MRLLVGVPFVALAVALVLWPRDGVQPVHVDGEPSRTASEPRDVRAAMPANESGGVAAARTDAGEYRGVPIAETNADLEAGEPAGEFWFDVEVLDEDGAPIVGAHVILGRPDPADPDEIRSFHTAAATGEDGVARLFGQHVGERIVHVDARPAGRDLMPEQWHVLLESGRATAVVVLRRGLSITGRIEWVDPVPDEPPPIALVATHAETEDRTRVVVATPEFALRGLTPGSYSVRGEGGCSPFVVDQVAAGSAGLVLEVKAPTDPRSVGLHMGEIHGRVVGGEASLSVAREPATASSAHVVRGRDGSFHAVGLEPGRWLVLVSRRRRSGLPHGPFQIAAGQIVRDVEIRVD